MFGWAGMMFLIFANGGVGQILFPTESECFDAKQTIVWALEEEGFHAQDVTVICVRIPPLTNDS